MALEARRSSVSSFYKSNIYLIFKSAKLCTFLLPLFTHQQLIMNRGYIHFYYVSWSVWIAIKNDTYLIERCYYEPMSASCKIY